MAIKFQYNKTSLNEIDKQLKMRRKALPTIKSKESALRGEVKRARTVAAEYDRRMEELIVRYDYMIALWGEFDPDILRIADIRTSVIKIAGVRIPLLEEIIFEQKDYDLFSSPLWLADGVALLKEFARLGLEREFYARKTDMLDHARKKTTQKVNLYEKVQIPGYEDAMRKIKRFMEDEENLSKSSQKMVKAEQARTEQEVAL